MIYVKAFLIAGIIVPVLLHLVAPEAMPWWPDAISMGIAAGGVGAVLVWKARTESHMNHRLWSALKALARPWRSS
jgi:hypothetical protein